MTWPQNLHNFEKPESFTSPYRLKDLKVNNTICSGLLLEDHPACSVTWLDGYEYPMHIRNLHSFAPVNLLIYPRRTSFPFCFHYDFSKNPHHRNYSNWKIVFIQIPLGRILTEPQNPHLQKRSLFLLFARQKILLARQDRLSWMYPSWFIDEDQLIFRETFSRSTDPQIQHPL